MEADGYWPPQDYSNRTCYKYGETVHIGKDFSNQVKRLVVKSKIDAASRINVTTNNKVNQDR